MKAFALALALTTPFAANAMCLARQYSNAHLVANPAQFIRSARVSLTSEGGSNYAHVNITHKDADASWTTAAYAHCRLTTVLRYVCSVDADGGHFNLEFRPTGIFLLVKGSLVARGVDPETGEVEDLIIEEGRDNGIIRLGKISDRPCPNMVDDGE